MIIEEYLNHTKTLQAEYGSRSIVLMQVGSFYEMYGLGEANGEIIGSHIVKVSKTCDLLIAKKAQRYGKHQVFMAGFGLPQLNKYVRRLADDQYTIAVYDQVEKLGRITREVREVISPGTYVESETQVLSNNTLCIVLTGREEKVDTASVAVIDMVTGSSRIEVVGKRTRLSDVVLDGIDRVSEITAASEILLISLDFDVSWLQKMAKNLGILERKIHVVGRDSGEAKRGKVIMACKQVYQRDVIVSAYECMTTEAVAGIMRESECDLSALVLLLDFVKDHNPDLLKGLQAPEIMHEAGILQMGTHSLSQLNILNNGKRACKLSSVIELMDNTVTRQGSRLLRERLHRPLSQACEIEKRLSVVETCIQDGFWKTTRKELEGIGDFMRVHRLASTGKLGADMQCRFCSWIEQSKALCELWRGKSGLPPDRTVVEALETLERLFADKLDDVNCRGMGVPTYERLIKCPADNMMLLRSGVDEECDGTVDTLALVTRQYEQILDACNAALIRAGEKRTKKATSGGRTAFTITEKDGPRITGTKRRLELIAKGPKFVCCDDAGKTYTSDDLEVTTLSGSKSTYVLTSPFLEKLCKRSRQLQCSLATMLSLKWESIMREVSSQAANILKVANFVANCDVVQSSCYSAEEYGYTKPVIMNEASSFIEAKKLRHPLIERLNTEEIYVPNDVSLGKEQKVVLLYGTNAVGKSSYIKAVGISVCLAQAGMYVPCDIMRLSPYSSLFSRILGNDDLFRGLSTFAVEMSELRTILNNASENSLVIGDELCSGTETSSALAIFASSVELLHDAASSAIFATHFHEIAAYEEIKALSRLTIRHMAVVYDEPSRSLVYDRKLRDGPGNNMYGLEVCKSLGLPLALLERAHFYRNKATTGANDTFSLTGTRYNQNRMRSKCEMCGGKSTEVHHLVHQANAVDGRVEHYKIHHSANLVNVCEECHLKFHNTGKQHRKAKTVDGRSAIIQM